MSSSCGDGNIEEIEVTRVGGKNVFTIWHVDGDRVDYNLLIDA